MVAAVTNIQSQEEGGSLSEADASATTDASLEAQWLVERLSGVQDILIGHKQRGITLSCVCLVQGWRNLELAGAGAKMEVGSNSEKVELRDDTELETNLEPHIDMRENTVCPLLI